MKESGAHAIKLEGGQRVARQVEDLVAAGIPVMAHLGLTPQSVHAFGGYRVQGRGEERVNGCCTTPRSWRRRARSPWSWRPCPRRSRRG